LQLGYVVLTAPDDGGWHDPYRQAPSGDDTGWGEPGDKSLTPDPDDGGWVIPTDRAGIDNIFNPSFLMFLLMGWSK